MSIFSFLWSFVAPIGTTVAPKKKEWQPCLHNHPDRGYFRTSVTFGKTNDVPPANRIYMEEHDPRRTYCCVECGARTRRYHEYPVSRFGEMFVMAFCADHDSKTYHEAHELKKVKKTDAPQTG